MKAKNYSDLDKNYRQATVLQKETVYYDVTRKPVSLEGFPFKNPNGRRSRIPIATAIGMKGKLRAPSVQTAGAVVRFRTDSTRIMVRAKLDEYYVSYNLAANAGFDFYTGTGRDMKFCGNRTIMKPTENYEGGITFPEAQMRDISIYLPLTCSFFKMEIGLDSGAELKAPAQHRVKGPLIFYGSSITNMGAASRPGLLYTSIIGRLLDAGIVNMGFSGNCFGEKCVADEALKLKPQIFILEYDANAPDPEFLRKTHEPFFRHLRKQAPGLPVLMISSPYKNFSQEDAQIRRAVITRTWLNAFEAGDRCVEFIDGETLLSGDSIREDCSMDCCHENDIGARLMAERMAERLKRMLEELKK